MILQVLPSISQHDAISQHVIRIDDELKKQGIESGIVAQYINPHFADRVTLPTAIDSFDDHHILYHMSMASSLAERIHASNAHVDMWYHNITPAHFFEPWEPYVSLELRIARYQFSQLSVRVDRGVAASRYSENELKQQGCRHTAVMPVLFDSSTKIISHSSQSDTPRRGATVLSVGRYAPHKRVEELIYALALYRELVDPQATLQLVGTSSSRWYKESLDQLVDNLGLKDCVHYFDGIDDAKLAQLYKDADVYLCLSEHEGFCVPLVEAQCAGLPIVAKNAAAIPETVRGAGIILDESANTVDVVAALDIVIHDQTVRTDLKQTARENCAEHDIDELAKQSVQWILAGSTI